MTDRPTVLSGIQPSGDLHLGNYLGAVRHWVAGQELSDSLFCIVNLHAITVSQPPEELRQKTVELAAMYMACGIDPKTSLIFVQSEVPAHAELAWLLTCMTPMGWLERMTQYKDKTAGKRGERLGAGILMYPVLMAADILLYQADEVPVGDDQRQHLELARDLAMRFNHAFGDTFTVPTARIPPPEAGGRIMSLVSPEQKMSKSQPEGCVFLNDPPELTRRKIMRAQTDSAASFSLAQAGPGIRNLLGIYSGVTSMSFADAVSLFEGKGYGAIKASVADAVVAAVAPIQEAYRALMAEPEALEEMLRAGAQRARERADATLAVAYDNTGLLPPKSKWQGNG